MDSARFQLHGYVGQMWQRCRRLPIQRFDHSTQSWQHVQHQGTDHTLDELTLTTYNIWFNQFNAEQRYLSIADLLARNQPDVMVFQEITEAALAVFLSRPWIREQYLSAAIADRSHYGMLLLSRVPVRSVRYLPLPTHLARGLLRADLSVGGRGLTVCSVHLESGRASAPLRARQLRKVFAALRWTRDAIVLGDFNMRDDENHLITSPYQDVWPTLRPGEPGYTEDTSINLMRYDMKNKHRHVRFDRAILKSGRWRPTEIELLGQEPIRPDLPRVFPSDHFGVRCKLTRR